MVDGSTIVMSIEILIVTSVLLAAHYGRKLDMTRHHWLIYAAMGIQGIILFVWMIPSFLFIFTNFGLSWLLGAHVFFGSITFLIALYLSVIFLKDRNEYDLVKLRYTKPLMILSTITWVISFLIGTIIWVLFTLLN